MQFLWLCHHTCWTSSWLDCNHGGKCSELYLWEWELKEVGKKTIIILSIFSPFNSHLSVLRFSIQKRGLCWIKRTRQRWLIWSATITFGPGQVLRNVSSLKYTSWLQMRSPLHLCLRLCRSHLSQPRVSGEAIDLQPNGTGAWQEHMVQVNPTKSHCEDSTHEKNLTYSWGTPLRNLLPQIRQMPGKCSVCWRPPKAISMLKNIMNPIFTSHLIIKEKKNYRSPETLLFNPLLTAACLSLMEQWIQCQSIVVEYKGWLFTLFCLLHNTIYASYIHCFDSVREKLFRH